MSISFTSDGLFDSADQEDAVDDQRSRDVLLVELDVQLVGDRQAEQVADERAVERGQKRDRHQRPELRGVRHVGEHLDHADERADHAPGRGAVAHRAIDLLPLLEMMEEDVAVALHRVLDELLVVAVGDVADALGEERVADLHALERHRAVLAHTSAIWVSSSMSSRGWELRIENANLNPSGSPCAIPENGKRIIVAASTPPPITISAWRS